MAKTGKFRKRKKTKDRCAGGKWEKKAQWRTEKNAEVRERERK